MGVCVSRYTGSKGESQSSEEIPKCGQEEANWLI